MVRKPTMLSNGDERVYATYRDQSINPKDPVQGFGRTVNLSTRDIGLEEAVVPTFLVTTMVNELQFIGVLLPPDVKFLQCMREHADFVPVVSSNRYGVFIMSGVPST